ncbi:hypothetical protein BWQ96_06232 [Gracilariopsis chorda]|uniref:Uncharacterized protein n=1 Tax=Gracilariopsis chorda TaxID=448386 RepID=A0A2V3IPM1_9FLOR|nr:hypothetical protein BWQ96_06232 [Gracilariopsis chorda]|eukprot:PXF43999.1 hypothetical protein BWQ96_06232 [Gracilariopsis chorda]
MTCVHQQCTPYFFQHVCGLFKPQNSSSRLSQIDAQLDTISARIRKLIHKRQQYFKSRVVNSTLQQYYTRSMQQIRQCDKLFIRALTQRAHHFDLSEYMQSVDYRIIRQEVKRLRFENDDFARHLNFWKRHNQTLTLVTRTSPDALRDARDALYKEMKNYETDALIIKSLRTGSYTKEKQARFTIRLRKKISKQLERLRTQNERVLREAQFIQEARTELYHLLLSIWQDIRKRRLAISCGRDVLSETVTSAFKSEISS